MLINTTRLIQMLSIYNYEIYFRAVRIGNYRQRIFIIASTQDKIFGDVCRQIHNLRELPRLISDFSITSWRK